VRVAMGLLATAAANGSAPAGGVPGADPWTAAEDVERFRRSGGSGPL
jgi:hypothetical protein